MIFFVKRGKGCGCGCLANLLALAFLGFLIFGGQTIYTAMTAGEQLQMSVADFVKTKSDKKWVKLTDAVLVYDHMISKGLGDSVTEVYIPIIAKGETRSSTAQLILASKQPEQIAFARGIAEAKGSLQKEMKVYSENPDVFKEARTIEGVVRYGIDDSERERKDMRKVLPGNLSRDYIILNDGEQPSVLRGLGFIGLAVLMLLLAGVSSLVEDWLNSKGKGAPGPPPLPPQPQIRN